MRAWIVHVDALDDEGDVDLGAEQPDAAGAVQRDPVPHVLDPALAPLALDPVLAQEVGRVDSRVDLEALVTVVGSLLAGELLVVYATVLRTLR